MFKSWRNPVPNIIFLTGFLTFTGPIVKLGKALMIVGQTLYKNDEKGILMVSYCCRFEDGIQIDNSLRRFIFG